MWRRFFKRLALYTRFSWIILWVIGRRFFTGPFRPKWTLKLEVVLSIMQHFRDENVPLERSRKSFEAMAGIVSVPVTHIPLSIPRDDGTRLPIEWTYPQGTKRIEDSPTPSVILYVHGGGYCLGSISTHRRLLSFFAHASASQALAVDYRLAPEHPYPAAVEDAMAAFFYLTRECGVPPQSIVIMGDSAGGGLSLALALSLCKLAKEKGISCRPGAVVCLSPWVNLDLNAELPLRGVAQGSSPIEVALREKSTLTSNAPTDYLPISPDPFMLFAQHYSGSEGLLRKFDVSPVFAPDEMLADLPPTLFITGGGEQLAGQISVLSSRMKKLNAYFEEEVYAHMPHVFQFLGTATPDTREATRRVVKFIHHRVVSDGGRSSSL